MPDADETAARCAGCGRSLRADLQFCVACGRGVADAAATPADAVTEEPAGPRRSLDGNWTAIKRAGAVFGLLLASSLVLGLAAKIKVSPWLDVAYAAAGAAIVFTFAGFYWRSIAPLLRLPRTSPRGALGLALLALVFFVAMHTYFTVLAHAGVPILNATGDMRKAGWGLVPMIVLLSLAPAIVEELAFRGIIQTSLEEVLDAREAWIIQAALFSVLHLLPLMFPSHFVMGLCFGYLRSKTRSLYPGMALHASWNAFVLCEEVFRF